MELLNDYIVVVVMATCFAIGYIIKHSLDFIPNKFIPLIMGALGIVLNVWMNTWVFSPQILLGGLASGLASTGAFELVTQLVPTGEIVSSVDETEADNSTEANTEEQPRAPSKTD